MTVEQLETLWNLMMALLDSREDRRHKMPSPSAVGSQTAEDVEQQEMDLGEFGGDSMGLGDDESEEAIISPKV